MARATVKVLCDTCGKEFEITKQCYNRREADSFEKFIKSQPTHQCKECYRHDWIEAQKTKEQVQKSELPFTLPVLKGSEKQIAWAESIRIKFLKSLDESHIIWDKVQKMMPSFWNDVVQNPESRFWIDSRNEDPLEKFKVYAELEVPEMK